MVQQKNNNNVYNISDSDHAEFTYCGESSPKVLQTLPFPHDNFVNCVFTLKQF